MSDEDYLAQVKAQRDLLHKVLHKLLGSYNDTRSSHHKARHQAREVVTAVTKARALEELQPGDYDATTNTTGNGAE